MSSDNNFEEMENFKNNEYKNQCKNYTFVPFIYDKVERIVVLGDIHGDYKMTIKLLEMSKVAKIVNKKKISRLSKQKKNKLNDGKQTNNKQKRNKKHNHIGGSEKECDLCNNNDNTDNELDVIENDDYEYEMEWIGGKTHVVQVGDQIDRCRPYDGMTCDNPKIIKLEDDEDSDVKILKLFTKLHEQAQKEGGAVISLLGNHELMNAQGEVQYVSFKGLHNFMRKYKEDGLDNNNLSDPVEIRKQAFQPGNEYGKFLGCTRNATVVIGSNLFVHAGIIDKLIEEFNFTGYKDLVNVNILIKKWLLGLVQTNVISNYIRPGDSMFWTRILGSIEPNKDMSYDQCSDNISNVLKLFHVDHLIIGHTPQSYLYDTNINGTCGNKIYRVDVGSSCAFDNVDMHLKNYGERHPNRKYQYLEILNDTEFNVYDENGKI
jgi:hypothetical protein